MVKLPKRVDLGLGYVVDVHEVSDADMRMEHEGELEPSFWDPEIRTLLVRSALPFKRRAYAYVRALKDVLIDMDHHLADEGVIAR